MWQALVTRTHTPQHVVLLRLVQDRWVPPAGAQAGQELLPHEDPELGVFPVPSLKPSQAAPRDPYGLLALAAAYMPMSPSETDGDRIICHEAVGHVMLEYATLVRDHIVSMLLLLSERQHGVAAGGRIGCCPPASSTGGFQQHRCAGSGTPGIACS